MDKATAHEVASAARRRQIVSAAIVLLSDVGYRGATFEAICTAAGLSSKRLITYHFSSKDELFAAVAAQIAGEAEAAVRSALGDATGARDMLAAVIRANVSYLADHLPEVRALQQILLNGGHELWERHHVESVHGLARLLAEGQRGGNFRPFDPQVMAAALRAAIDGMVPLVSAGLDPDLCGRELVELFARGTRTESNGAAR